MAVLPWDLRFDLSNNRLLLLSEGGEIYVFNTDTEQLTDKIDNIGMQPKVKINPDLPRNRYIVGSTNESHPVLFEALSLSKLGNFGNEGSALAISPGEGMVFQTGVSAQETSPLYIYDATSGDLIKEIPTSYSFSKTLEMAVDETNKILYGTTSSDRGNGLGQGIWAFDWNIPRNLMSLFFLKTMTNFPTWLLMEILEKSWLLLKMR